MSDGVTPSDDMIVLAATVAGGEWKTADNIAATLRRLGFKITPQKMVGHLKRLCAEDSPMIESRTNEWARLKEYRVTSNGDMQLGNRFPRTRGLRRV